MQTRRDNRSSGRRGRCGHPQQLTLVDSAYIGAVQSISRHSCPSTATIATLASALSNAVRALTDNVGGPLAASVWPDVSILIQIGTCGTCLRSAEWRCNRKRAVEDIDGSGMERFKGFPPTTDGSEGVLWPNPATAWTKTIINFVHRL